MRFKPLEPPATHLISSAVGWAELGNHAEARAELDRLPRELCGHPQVLEAQWLIAVQAERWDEALDTAKTFVDRMPDHPSGWLHLAYAVRRARGGGLQQAWDTLLPAAEKFPKEPTIAYNLSCYACQMQQMNLARHWLNRAVTLAGKRKIKEMGLQDSDLEPLWTEIREL